MAQNSPSPCASPASSASSSSGTSRSVSSSAAITGSCSWYLLRLAVPGFSRNRRTRSRRALRFPLALGAPPASPAPFTGASFPRRSFCVPARLRGALEAPPSLVARRRLLAPQSRRHRAPPARPAPQSRRRRAPAARSLCRPILVTQHGEEDLLSLGLDTGEMLRAPERLGVELVDVLGPRRPGGEPARLGADLDSAERFPVARRGGEPAYHRLPGELAHVHLIRAELGQRRLLLAGGRGIDARVGRVAEPGGELAVMFRRRLACDRRDLGREQRQDDAVLVGGPDAPVAAEERGAGALLAAERDRAVQQARHEPLEPDRHLGQPAPYGGAHPVDDRGADHGLADRGVRGPALAVAVEVVNRDGQVVVGVEQ